VAVTVSHVSAVDRMVSKENVQTAHPYDTDLATLGAWIEKRRFFQGPVVGDSNCFVTGTGILARIGQGRSKKILGSACTRRLPVRARCCRIARSARVLKE